MSVQTNIEPAILVTLFSGFTNPVENIPFSALLNRIQQGDFKKNVEEIRSLKASGNFEKADIVKKQLLAFTPSATFKTGRKPEYIDNYYGLIHLDYDKVPAEELSNLRKKIEAVPYTFACFLSPSGNGFKVFVLTMASKSQHTIFYDKVMRYYNQELGISADAKCKDITRLCFCSFDPLAFINNDSLYFDDPVITPLPVKQASPVNVCNNFEALDFCLKLTETKCQYVQGERNNFIYLFASNCNRSGIEPSEAVNFVLANFDLSPREVENCVKSAYSNHVQEFAKFANSAVIPKNDDVSVFEDVLKSTVLLSDSVFENLPSILKHGASAFSDKRERDVFITGAIAVLSGCLPNVSGVYAQQTVYPNMFCFIIAPAASGKGALKFSKMLADDLHSEMLSQSREALKEYEADLADYRNRARFPKKGEPLGDAPEKPLFKVLYIPANSSYAKIISHIEQNLGAGIICETEADTMGNVFKQEWGSYSDLLRKSFHHERISSSKKTNNEYIEVENPRVSIALSGTPAQVAGLISSSEDGLFSRFIFYAFKVEQQWRDVSPYANNVNLTDHFSALSKIITELHLFLDNSPTTICLTRNQWEKLNETCASWLSYSVVFNGEDSGSIVKRFGLIIFRLCMVFSALRKFEAKSEYETINCSNIDFENAVSLVHCYLLHSFFMFQNLPRQDSAFVAFKSNNKSMFYEALPVEFKRSDAIALGPKFNLSERSIDGLLKSLLGKHLSQPSFGVYKKIV